MQISKFKYFRFKDNGPGKWHPDKYIISLEYICGEVDLLLLLLQAVYSLNRRASDPLVAAPSFEGTLKVPKLFGAKRIQSFRIKRGWE